MIGKFRDLFSRSRAIFFIIGLTTAGILGIVLLFNVSDEKNINFIARYSINKAEEIFIEVERKTANMLSAALRALLEVPEIRESYLSGDRKRLYRTVQPLYRTFREQNGITHWYFLNPEPDKTCFLRIHAPEKRGDRITRITMERSIKTKDLATGIELGKTAFALRAVHPYYDGERLIGYMELAVDIEYFFNDLKKKSDMEFGLLVEKKFIDKAKWESVSARKRRETHWNDMQDLLLICSTSPDQDLIDYSGGMEAVPDGGRLLERIKKGTNLFVRGIFPLYDAGNRKVGGVFVLKDITHIYSALQEKKRDILFLVVLFMVLLTLLMIFFHKRAEKELRKYRSHLEEMIDERTRELEVQFEARVEAEKKRSEAVKLAEKSARLASIGVMAAGITHEINQPLNAIKVTADSIQYWHKRNPGILPDMFVGQLENISKSVHRIVEIIQHMRTFWIQPDSPKISTVNLNQAVTNALSLTRQQLNAHGIRHRLKKGADPIPIKANLIHLEQIVLNLITNAIRSLDETARKDKMIRLTTASADGFALLTVRDNGVGLPEVGMEKLFSPFFSTRADEDGTGLGLAIVKNYIDRYKGEITSQNNGPTEGGVTFTLRFPLLPAKGVSEKK